MIRVRNLVLLIVILTFSVCYSQNPRLDISGDFLLKTKWSGSKPFSKYAPNQASLGCHSVAIAQILNYHKLAPQGKVNYFCSNDLEIKEDFSKYKAEFDRFACCLNDDDTQINLTAKYIYKIATIIKKDFGTDQYIKCDDFHDSEIESHFNCQYAAYPRTINSNLSEVLLEKNEFYSLVKAEIDAYCPVGFYYTNNRGSGHAVVLDGYYEHENKVYVHANFGWGGKSDGWYLLEEDLPKDLELILLITIRPNATP